MDFINQYLPATAELTQEELYDVRDRLVAYFEAAIPDVETNPNSVVGDLIITPQAYLIAALEKGLTRFANDLDLGNVANGNVCNCEFVTQWLNNFSVDSSLRLKASGVIRLTFSESKEYVLDRNTIFSAGESKFSLYMPYTGAYTIYRPNAALPSGVNGTKLIDTGSGTFFADVVVVGEISEAEIAIGAGFTLNNTIPELISASALIPFNPGTEVISLKDLAKRARTTLYSASLNTRNGAIQYVNSICPFVDGVYATHNGDREMLRDFDNPLGVSLGCLDLYVRSKGYNFTEEQQLLLYLNDDETAFEGEFPYVGQPYHIESVTNSNVADIVNLDHEITSTFLPLPGTSQQYPGAVAAYTPYERLSIKIPDVVDEEGDSKFQPSIAENGRRYAIFTIKYQTDPMLQAIAQTVESEDCRPINTSILVRGFIPVIIDSYEIVYVREPGVLPDLETAAIKIKEYMGNLGAPDVYSDAEITHIMHDYGVKYVKAINVQARVQWVVGQKVQDRTGKIVDVMPGPYISSSDGLRITYPSDVRGLTADSMYVCSVRNIRYWFMEGALTFKEVRDI